MSDDYGPSSFFRSVSRAFDATIASRRQEPDLVGLLCAQAFDNFANNAAIQAQEQPALACQGECAACCRLRVVATAPEVFLIARFVSLNYEAFAARGVSLSARISEADRAVGGMTETQRLKVQYVCPFIEKELCLAYRVRPLACRGHAAFDRKACVAAAKGEATEAFVSTPYLVVRSLVQNAMMSALRRTRLAWGLYELNRALRIAITQPNRSNNG